MTFIAAKKQEHSIRLLCRALDITESAFYAWQKRVPRDEKTMGDYDIRKAAKEIWLAHKKRLGLPRLRHLLATERGIFVGPNRLRRLMNETGICRKPRNKRVKTTVGCDAKLASPNLVARDFSAKKPGLLWLSDITYIKTEEGFLHLCVIIDVRLAKSSAGRWIPR